MVPQPTPSFLPPGFNPQPARSRPPAAFRCARAMAEKRTAAAPEIALGARSYASAASRARRLGTS